jgi:phosphatidylserine/phosphatidylglycerophosphate/cardiolipin synthase-like enzyme
VAITIGYGLGPSDEGARQSDDEAERELLQLARDRASVVVHRLGDTHAKVLIKDAEYCVTTSFNWLSFLGDPRRSFREEWGTKVTDPSYIEHFYEELRKRFPDSPT